MCLKARLLAISQYASGRLCERPTRSRFSVVFLGPKAMLKSVPQIHVALHASHSTLPTLSKIFVILSRNKILPKCSIFFMLHTVHFKLLSLLHITAFISCLQPTFPRRTSGHCLANFRAINFLVPSVKIVIIKIIMGAAIAQSV